MFRRALDVARIALRTTSSSTTTTPSCRLFSTALPESLPTPPPLKLDGHPLLHPTRASTAPSLHAPNLFVPGTKRRRMDVVRRQLVAHYEVYRNVLKALSYDASIPAPMRFLFAIKLHSLPLNTCRTRIVTRCVLNRRPRGVSRFFRINRIDLKLRFMRGQVAGMSRATWNRYGRQLQKKWHPGGFGEGMGVAAGGGQL